MDACSASRSALSLIAGGVDLRAIVYALLSLTVVRMVPVAVALVGTRFQP